MSTPLTIEEARLIAVYRAISRFPEHGLVGAGDASVLTAYLEGLVNLEALDALSSDAVVSFLDGFVAGFGAARLASADVDPSQLNREPDYDPAQVQTGVDPRTGEVRH